MPCPHCRSATTTGRRHRTVLGYRRFNFRACSRRFNERTGTPFNVLQHPTDLVPLPDGRNDQQAESNTS